MAAIVTSREIESVVRRVLSERGYEVSIARDHGETGADIIASEGDEIVHIEAIAFKGSPPARAKDFYESFFRATYSNKGGMRDCAAGTFRNGPSSAGAGDRNCVAAHWRRVS